MKTTRWLAALCGLWVAGAGSGLAATASADARAEVIYDHPEKFTDVKDSSMPTDEGSAAILSNLREYLVHEARTLIPDGYKLTMVFSDIDLAGDFEPWRGAQFDNIRIVKAIYPPHFKFTYKLTDPTGRVIREGQEDLVDMAFDMRITIDHDDPLHYEKSILKDWMHRQLRGAWPRSAARTKAE
jgi:hypothetical protein